MVRVVTPVVREPSACETEYRKVLSMTVMMTISNGNGRVVYGWVGVVDLGDYEYGYTFA